MAVRSGIGSSVWGAMGDSRRSSQVLLQVWSKDCNCYSKPANGDFL